LHPQSETAPLEMMSAGKIEARAVVVQPHAAPVQFEANRVETSFTVTRPFRPLPDPRFVEWRDRESERVVGKVAEDFPLTVGGDYEPVMRFVTFRYAENTVQSATPLPHWRFNDGVVPYDRASLSATLGADPKSEVERAFAVFKYAMDVTQYYNDAVRYVNYSSLFRALAQSVVTLPPLEKTVGKYI
jgi:hypothetical protein